MGTLRCPMCGKINPEELEACRYCHARLKPLVIPSEDTGADKPGTKILDGAGDLPGTKQLDLPEDDADWLGALRGTPKAPDPAQPIRPFIDQKPGGVGTSILSDNSDEEAPDWLENVRRKSAQDGILGKPGLGIPDLSKRTPFTAPLEESDWLDDLRSEPQAPPPPEPPKAARPAETARLVEPELPADWISRLSPRQPPPVQRPGTRPLGDLEEPEALDMGSSFKPDDLPDWLQEISAMSGPSTGQPEEPKDLSEDLPRMLGIDKGTPPGAQPPAGEAAVTTPEGDLPEWVRQFRSRTGPLPALTSEPAVPQPPDTAPLVWPDGEPPDARARGEASWLKPAVDIPPTPRVGAEPPRKTEETVPDWLASLEEKSGWTNEPAAEPAGEGPGSREPREATEFPGWLGDVSPAADLFGSPQSGVSQSSTGQDDEWPAPAELPSWILAMRPIETVAPSAPEARVEEEPHVEASGPLAGLHGTLSLEPVVAEYTRPPVYSLQLQVTERQRLHGEIFDELLAGESQPAQAPAQPLISSQRILRVLIALALIAAVVIPLVTGFQILPIPAAPPAEVLHVQESVAALPDGAPVLVAVDYSPAVTGEMEAAAAGLVDQLMARGARLTLISTSPAGTALAGHLLEKVFENPQSYMAPYASGEKVAALGYLAGGTAGLAGFVSHPQFTSPYTVDGRFAWEQPALQGVPDLAGFARIIVLTESLETGRAWIEQTGIELGQPGSLLVVASAQSAPLLRPYVESGQAGGMIAGLSGGAAYEQLAGRAGPGAAYWNAFQGGLWVSILLILGGVLVNGIRTVLELRKVKRGSRMISATFIWSIVALLLTLLVLTYLVIGDNPIFRAATYAFIGIGAAYVILITFNQVIWPKFFLVLLMPGSPLNEKILLIVPLILVVLLLAKLSPRLAGIGSPAMAYLVGVGAAVIIGGSVLGTLFPQTIAGINLFDLGAAQARGSGVGMAVLEGLIALVGTAATLLFFHFGAPSRPGNPAGRGGIVGTAAQVGQVFLAVTLGAVFAGVYIAALTALVERTYFVLQFIF